ncbi:MAG: hypothetical protein HC876_18580 [Chloroflexaceae bacterium]|nr:hypothetical protein [Chloroflexaceae bacterium]
MERIRTLERRPQVKQAGPPPLLVMLHGFGSNENDLMGMAPYLDERFHIISLRGIFSLGSWMGAAWYILNGTPGNLIPTRKAALTPSSCCISFCPTCPPASMPTRAACTCLVSVKGVIWRWRWRSQHPT